MKKMGTKIAAAALVLSLGVTGACAAGGHTGNRTGLRTGTQCGQFFTDANGDGICDNRTVLRTGTQCGQFFTDANGDGICDNRNLRVCPNNGICHSGRA